MRNIFRLLFLTIAFSAAQRAIGANVVWFDGHNHVSYIAHQSHSPLVKIALDLFAEDMKAVTGHRAVENHKGKIEIEYYSDDELNRIFEMLQTLK